MYSLVFSLFFLCFSPSILGADSKDDLRELSESHNARDIAHRLKALLRAKTLRLALAELSPEESEKIFGALLRANKSDHTLCDDLFNEFLAAFRSRMENNNQVNQKLLRIAAPFLYKINVENFSKLIFSEHPRLTKVAALTVSDVPVKIIYNNNGYLTRRSNLSQGIFERGEPLRLDHNTPIGYNVHMPHGEIKAIITDIYGGAERKESYEEITLPGELKDLHRFLLSQGIAVVRLNLLDLRELVDFQADMPYDIHKRLHQSIYKYFKTFTTPDLLEKLHPDLAPLHGLPIFLSGSSFGGGNAVRFAEYYPHTFNGYISFNGSLNFAAMDRSDQPGTSNAGWHTRKAHLWLDPMLHLGSLKDRVLLVQSLDDNTVKAAVPIEFFREADEETRKNIKLLLLEHGSSLRAHDRVLRKGHSLVMSSHLANYIVRFIKQNSSSLSHASDLRAQVHSRRGYGITSKQGRNFSLHEKYLWMAELFDHYYASNHAVNDALWEKEYLPIIQALAILKHCYTTPDLYAYLKNELKALTMNDEYFALAIHKNMPRFAQFLIEKYRFTIDAQILAQILIDNTQIASIFKAWLSNDQHISSCFYNYLAYMFLSTNGEFTAKLLDRLQAQMDVSEVALMNGQFNSARKAFFADIGQTHTLAIKLWRQAFAAVLERKRLERR